MNDTKQRPSFIQYKQTETEVEWLSGHVEPCRGIPHTHPATVTYDSWRSSIDQQIKTQQQPFLHPCGEWNRNAKKNESVEKRVRTDVLYRLVRDSLLFSLTPSLSPLTSSSSYPPLLSEAVTPARCTSLTPHVAFLSFPEKSLVK